MPQWWASAHHGPAPDHRSPGAVGEKTGPKSGESVGREEGCEAKAADAEKAGNACSKAL